MAAIATGYYINRIFGITLTIIFLTVSFIQIFLLRQNTKKLSDVKYFIHYSVCLSCATLLLSFIDSYGVFGLFPYIFSVMTVDVFGMKCLSSSALFIIYGHFDAHYRVLKQETPQFFKLYLSILFILTLIGSIIFQSLSYATSKTIYITLAGINGLIWLYGIWSIDIYGYYLVRKFILDLQKYSRTASPSIHEMSQEEGTPTSVSSSSPSLPPKKQGSSRHICSNEFDYDGFLSRMRNFHILLTIITIIFSGLTIFSLTRSNLRQTLNPHQFSFFDGLIFYPYLYFLVGCFLLWWVWLPIKIKDNCTLKLDSHHGNSQKTTQIHSRNSGKVSKRENHPHHQEEMVILNSNQNHDNNPQENSPQHYPDKNRFSYPPNSGDVVSQDETSLIRENNNNNHTREHSVSVSEMESPKKENRLGNVTMAGITEEGGIVSYDEK